MEVYGAAESEPERAAGSTGLGKDMSAVVVVVVVVRAVSTDGGRRVRWGELAAERGGCLFLSNALASEATLACIWMLFRLSHRQCARSVSGDGAVVAAVMEDGRVAVVGAVVLVLVIDMGSGGHTAQRTLCGSSFASYRRPISANRRGRNATASVPGRA